MSRWTQSLIKLASYEVETLQKRLSDVVDRRMATQLRLTRLLAEADAEMANAAQDDDAAMSLSAYLDGLRVRKAAIQSEIETILIEETGARDALAEAFEAQKKYEQVAESARVLQVKEAGRRETAALDELGLRKAR
ncbi:flagellar export protein FliJ [Phenylobacterium sp. J426]|uniref:flagellar export protein FliJ n=1 Tax=Phenylobacterium sp. J426 TaxID=2898439 RepID=UPI002151DD71|nr:flagellar export protein FliJ [Phenylobacterium sp. J426]MCR5874836.1 flagellar export protein FliJ [Phenylobacterium sp. J426]